jgi:hypothetical protein
VQLKVFLYAGWRLSLLFVNVVFPVFPFDRERAAGCSGSVSELGKMYRDIKQFTLGRSLCIPMLMTGGDVALRLAPTTQPTIPSGHCRRPSNLFPRIHIQSQGPVSSSGSRTLVSPKPSEPRAITWRWCSLLSMCTNQNHRVMHSRSRPRFNATRYASRAPFKRPPRLQEHCPPHIPHSCTATFSPLADLHIREQIVHVA